MQVLTNVPPRIAVKFNFYTCPISYRLQAAGFDKCPTPYSF